MMMLLLICPFGISGCRGIVMERVTKFKVHGSCDKLLVLQCNFRGRVCLYGFCEHSWLYLVKNKESD